MVVDGDYGREEVEDSFSLFGRLVPAFLSSSRNPIQITKGKKMGLLKTTSFKTLKCSQNNVILVD